MNSPDASPSAQVSDCVRREILTAFPSVLTDWTTERAEVLRGQLHALHYYAAAQQVETDVLESLAAAQQTAEGLWELLEQNAMTLLYLRQMETIRGLDLGSNLAGQSEFITTGETSLSEFTIGAIATGLSWFSDTIWVDLARLEQHAVPRAHALGLQDLLWEFLGRSNVKGKQVSLPEAQALQAKLARLFKVLGDEELPSAGRVLLSLHLYVLLLTLNLGAILRPKV